MGLLRGKVVRWLSMGFMAAAFPIWSYTSDLFMSSYFLAAVFFAPLFYCLLAARESDFEPVRGDGKRLYKIIFYAALCILCFLLIGAAVVVASREIYRRYESGGNYIEVFVSVKVLNRILFLTAGMLWFLAGVRTGWIAGQSVFAGILSGAAMILVSWEYGSYWFDVSYGAARWLCLQDGITLAVSGIVCALVWQLLFLAVRRVREHRQRERAQQHTTKTFHS